MMSNRCPLIEKSCGFSYSDSLLFHYIPQNRQQERYDQGQYCSCYKRNESQSRTYKFCNRRQHRIHISGSTCRNCAPRTDFNKQWQKQYGKSFTQYIYNEPIGSYFNSISLRHIRAGNTIETHSTRSQNGSFWSDIQQYGGKDSSCKTAYQYRCW